MAGPDYELPALIGGDGQRAYMLQVAGFSATSIDVSKLRNALLLTLVSPKGTMSFKSDCVPASHVLLPAFDIALISSEVEMDPLGSVKLVRRRR